MATTSTEVLTTSNNNDAQLVGIPFKMSGGRGKPKNQQILVGWDRQRSFTFLGLSLCFVVWACVYFPLIMQ